MRFFGGSAIFCFFYLFFPSSKDCRKKLVFCQKIVLKMSFSSKDSEKNAIFIVKCSFLQKIIKNCDSRQEISKKHSLCQKIENNKVFVKVCVKNAVFVKIS